MQIGHGDRQKEMEMKLNLSNENTQELACGLRNAKLSGITDTDLQDVGDWMAQQAKDSLTAAGIEWCRCYTQSRGSLVIVQSATEDEQEVWDRALEQCEARAETMLASIAAQTHNDTYKIVNDRYGGDMTPVTLDQLRRECAEVWPEGCDEFDDEAEHLAFITLELDGDEIVNGNGEVVARRCRND